MKICEICGDDFQESRATQKYCQKCGKNPQKAKAFYEKAQQMVRRHAGVSDNPKVKNCVYCNKEFATFYGAKFCSKKCETQYRIETAECTFCHTNLYALGIIITNTNGGIRFCSDECKEQYYAKIKSQRSLKSEKKTCPFCQKEFEGYAVFCSKDCYKKAVESGWKPARYRKITVNCNQCHKPFETSETHPASTCEDCVRKRRLQLREQEKLQLEQKKKAEEAEKQKKLEEGIKKNGLCFYCQTTHFNCERMQSNFIHYPKGCKVVQGKVVECPSYTEKSSVVRKRKSKK